MHLFPERPCWHGSPIAAAPGRSSSRRPWASASPGCCAARHRRGDSAPRRARADRDEPYGHGAVVIDDAHLLDAERCAAARRVRRGRSSRRPPDRCWTVPARAVHEVAHLARRPDPRHVGAGDHAPTRSSQPCPSSARPVAEQVVQAADGCIKVDRHRARPVRSQPRPGPGVAWSPLAAQRRRRCAALLDAADRGLVSLLARTPGSIVAARLARAAPASCGGCSRPASRSPPGRRAASTLVAPYASPTIESATALRSGRGADRARPAHRGDRAAARRRRAGPCGPTADGPARVGHQVRRASSDARPARPTRHGHRQRTGAAAAAGHAAAADRASRSGGRRRRSRRRPRRATPTRRCGGASRRPWLGRSSSGPA